LVWGLSFVQSDIGFPNRCFAINQMMPNPSHVGFVTLHRAGIGGSEMLWSLAARDLKKSGSQITVFHHVKPGAEHGERLWSDIAVSVGCLPSKKSQVGRIFDACRRMVLGLPESRFRAALRKRKPDILIINCGGHLTGREQAEVCRELRQPYGLIIQLANDIEWPSDSIRESYKSMYFNSALNVFVSRHNLEMVETMLGQRLKNAVIIHNPCLLAADHHSLPWPASMSPVRMALPARLDIHDKGHDVLLQVLARPQWRERDLLLNLYGQGRNEQGIRDLVQLLGLQSRVNFCGHVSDLSEIWRSNHLLVMPSRAEGLPLALIEAMHAGRPAVVTNVGGNCELVTDGETGFVAEAPVPHSFSEALERAWQAKQQWQKMGLKACSKVAELWRQDPAQELAGQINIALAALSCS
jgi:glycosyltransferase involved in cell wall biosynthesis